jgi:hypothetical protein
VIQFDPFAKSEEGVGTGWQFNMFDAGGLKVVAVFRPLFSSSCSIHATFRGVHALLRRLYNVIKALTPQP